jgi:hypothetical protein
MGLSAPTFGAARARHKRKTRPHPTAAARNFRPRRVLYRRWKGLPTADMKTRFLLPLLLSLTPFAAAAGRPGIVTFSRVDAARVAAEVCGSPGAASGPAQVRRNTDGTMVYSIVDFREVVLLTNSQQCNKVDSDVLDLWRNDKGEVVAQLQKKSEGLVLMVGDKAEMRGRRFDVERTGNYLVTSHGTTSTLTAVSRPYRVLLRLDMDAQRLFERKRSLLVVGGNPATGMLEGRMVRVNQGELSEGERIPLPNIPAGVRVLDYSAESDELLLGGVNAAGQTAFLVVGVGSGSSSGVASQKPGDDAGLFLSDRALRSRLSGSAAGAETEGGSKKRGGLRLPF